MLNSQELAMTSSSQREGPSYNIKLFDTQIVILQYKFTHWFFKYFFVILVTYFYLSSNFPMAFAFCFLFFLPV